ncbi:MAG: ribokinase [Planctomycetota bacterium]|nr:MAG: ribokinase [Planctomycetota bacterium]
MIWNLGSLNLDLVYAVPWTVRPGETISSSGMQRHPGGKGANQSVAAARAGASVQHLGAIGADGQLLRQALVDSGVGVDGLRQVPGDSGHAIIQLAEDGENAIVVFPGANHALDEAALVEHIAQLPAGTWLLCQNETNGVAAAMAAAARRGLPICCNPAPMTEAVVNYPLHEVSLLVLNQSEAQALCGGENPDPRHQLASLRQRYPRTTVVITLGAQGAWCMDEQGARHHPAQAVDRVVDTTAAGDTFVGYTLAGLDQGLDIDQALKRAACAAAITVTRPGAIPAIPWAAEID